MGNIIFSSYVYNCIIPWDFTGLNNSAPHLAKGPQYELLTSWYFSVLNNSAAHLAKGPRELCQ